MKLSPLIFQTLSHSFPKTPLALLILFTFSSSKEVLELMLLPKYGNNSTYFKVVLKIWRDGTLYWERGSIMHIFRICTGFGWYITPVSFSFVCFCHFVLGFYTVIVRPNAFEVEENLFNSASWKKLPTRAEQLQTRSLKAFHPNKSLYLYL